MDHKQDKINELKNRLDLLVKSIDQFSNEIEKIRLEIKNLSIDESTLSEEEIKSVNIDAPENANIIQNQGKEQQIDPNPGVLTEHNNVSDPIQGKSFIKARELESFIGENLLNKIGIGITIIGVGIGAKYAIDHRLVSPVTRIILGYIMGLGLLGFAFRLKKNYENFSSVLLSGAMAILYFISFLAYNFYNLFPQLVAFLMMLLFTVFTVFAALSFNKQVIAHIGLVGAYAVPFLLSDGSDRANILFSYMSIINLGILFIAMKKYWKPLYYSAFFVSWIIFFFWYLLQYNEPANTITAFIFLLVFFLIFYLTSLLYKLLSSGKFQRDDIFLLLANSFIFFGIGISLLAQNSTSRQYLGLFCVCNALLHLMVCFVIYRLKLSDRFLLHVISTLVFIIIGISIPVQFDGRWVSLFWAIETAFVFWLGRYKNILLYERLAYFLFLLTFASLLRNWESEYLYIGINAKLGSIGTPIFNSSFLSSIIVTLLLGFVSYLNQKTKHHSAILMNYTGLWRLFYYLIPTIFIFSLYYTFIIEIQLYWSRQYLESIIKVIPKHQLFYQTYMDEDLKKFMIVWLINYTMLFLSVLSYINIYKIRDKLLGYLNLALNSLVLVVFFTLGLTKLGILLEHYTQQAVADLYKHGVINLIIRYISLGFVFILLDSCYRFSRVNMLSKKMDIYVELLVYLSILWLLSNEVITWLKFTDSLYLSNLGISVLWGVYSLLLIILGIWRKKKYLRVSAIALFAITLCKLFFVDMANLETIPKTILVVMLGVLLLIISFLYNKYRKKLFQDPKEID